MAQTQPSPSSSPLPPASAEYETAMHAPPGKLPQVRKWKMFRSSKGETHLDFGKTGLISKPGAKQTILLDHVKREARIVPTPDHAQAPPPSPQAPGGAPHLPAPPSAFPHVEDLGKKMIGGHEAEGKKYTFQPPKAPAAPDAKGLPGFKGPKLAALPKVPGLPKLPGMQPPGAAKPPTPGPAPPGVATPTAGKPQAPGAPGPAPAAPHGKVQTLEVWTHTKLKIPVLTKANGMPGLQSSVCKEAKGGEPPASLFQIPPGYKLVKPQPPAPPRPRV